MNKNIVSITLEKKFLLIPIWNGARMTRIDLSIDGQNVREFEAELATTKEQISFWSFLDITAFQGMEAILKLDGATEEGISMIVQANEIPGADAFYSESLRPQFHFSQMLGWNNDPNGMVYYDGEWHLYFQHNPYGWKWGNMHWGHATSTDLVHWKQLPIAIYNKQYGDWAFSGSAVVDENNTAGWQIGDEKVIVASWTSTGRGECIAYSNDRGRTFTEYEGNPVVQHTGRDPKIIWYQPGEHWVMAVYDESEETERSIAFYTSEDMKNWEFQSKLKDYCECAEIFELPVDGDTSNTRWVAFAADARYAIGQFDGKVFLPEHDGKHQVHHGGYYASQLFNNSPDGRKIQIGWAQIEMPNMPFNQTFSFPHSLTLRTTGEGIRMFAEPVKEIQKLHQKRHFTENINLTEGQLANLDVSGELFDIRARFEINNATTIGINIGGEQIIYNVQENQLNDAEMKPVNGEISVQILVDRPMMEIIGNNGRVFLTISRRQRDKVSIISAFAEGGQARLISLEANELRSIW